MFWTLCWSQSATLPSYNSLCIRLANSKARIKPTAPLSAFDKENSIEFPLDSVQLPYESTCSRASVDIKRKEKEKKNNIQNKRKEKEKEKKIMT